MAAELGETGLKADALGGCGRKHLRGFMVIFHGIFMNLMDFNGFQWDIANQQSEI